MPLNVLEEFVRQYIESQPTSTVSFAWQGGEPTLPGVDYFRKIVALQQKHAHGKQIENTLQTNGILLDDQWCDFLARNSFLIGLSIDGTRRLHDCYRLGKGGMSSYDGVLRSVGYLKKHGVEFNTLTVVQRNNSQYPLEVYRSLKEIGSGFMQFIPAVERIADVPTPDGLMLVPPDSLMPAQITGFSVEPLQYGKFLCEIFDDWVRNDVGKVFVQIFDVALAAWVGMDPGLCVFRTACGSSVVIEHNGDIYSCDHFVYPGNKLGNIMDQTLESMMKSSQQIRFGRDKVDRLPKTCHNCSVQFICNGECPKHRFMPTGDGKGNLNYLCPGYKLFFSHIKPCMEFMAAELRAERPPANVMTWLRDRNARNETKLGRNNPCPCGSGLKYKRCCGKT